jgi:hypothetical protein
MSQPTPSENFRAALLELVDDYVETSADAQDAIEALDDRAIYLRQWMDKQEEWHK